MCSELMDKIKEYSDRIDTFTPGVTYIPVHGSVFNGDESSSLISAILGSNRDYLKAFTIQMADYLGQGHILVCNSSISAHILILKALSSESLGSKGVRRGDEIITTANNIGIINAATAFGVIPIIVDVDLNTMLPDLVSIEMAIVEGKTKAIIMPSVCGNSIHGEMIRDIADDFSIMYIEDIGYGFGSLTHGVPVGTYADISIYSFHSPLLGDAGVIVSKSILVHMLITEVMSNNVSPMWMGLESSPLVYSYLSAQMDKHVYYTSMRRLNWSRLYTGLLKYHKFFRFHKPQENCTPSWTGFVLTLKEPSPFYKTEIIEFLHNNGVGSVDMVGNYYKLPAYKSILREGEELINSNYINRNSFMIGCNPTMREEHTDYMIKVISTFLEKYEQKIED